MTMSNGTSQSITNLKHDAVFGCAMLEPMMDDETGFNQEAWCESIDSRKDLDECQFPPPVLDSSYLPVLILFFALLVVAVICFKKIKNK